MKDYLWPMGQTGHAEAKFFREDINERGEGIGGSPSSVSTMLACIRKNGGRWESSGANIDAVQRHL
jgi:hypothetical protein